MNKRLQVFVAGILCCVMFASISVFAKNATETIQALYKDIKIYVDGVKIDPKDANGNKVEPFISNGTTYLPVRAVGDAIGKQVTWDGATSSVYLGDVPGESTNWVNQCMPYKFVDSNGSMILSQEGKFSTMSGKKYTDGFTLGRNGYIYSISTALFNLDSNYKNVTFTVGHVDDTNNTDAKIIIYLDEKLVESFDVSYDSLPQEISIQLNYANQMKIEVVNDSNHGGGLYDFFDGHFE